MACKEINVTVGKKELNLAVEKTIVNYSGTSNFLSLTDTPNNYTDSAGKLLRVKSTEDGIEFTDSPTVVDWNEIGGDQSDISLSGFTNDSGFISNLTTFTTDNLIEGTTNLYDKEVVLNAGTGIGISGSYPEFTITNNQVSAVWGNITGTLTDQIDLSNALNLKYNSSSFNTDWDSRLATKTTDNLTEGSNKYDKTVALTAGDGIQVTGTYPNFTITNVSEGNTDHSELDNLDYANSGHTGFQPAGNYLTSESDPVFASSQAKNITQTDITNLSNLSGTNTGDQESSDFDIKDLTDSTNLRNSWTGKQDALGFTPENSANKGQNNGYASLDAGGKVPVNELPNSIIEYKGTWNASTNTPTLIDGTGNAGDVYIVSVAGTQNLGSGNISFLEGDWAMYNGTIWQKSINSNAVVSVNTQTGVVTLDADDISDTSTTNKFVTSTDITNLSNLSGTNSGDQESSDFDIKDLTDSTNLRTTWSGKQDALTAGTNINITDNTISATDTTYSSGDFNLSSLGDVDDTAKATGKILQVNADGDHEYVDLPDPDVSGLVPYTGATSDVDLGNYDLTATDITSEGNLIISNNKYLQSVDVAGTGKVDILKVNTSDEILAGDDFNFGLLEFSTITEPISPDQESTYMYQEATGTRPNRVISLLTKNELGEKVIVTTTIV